MFNCSRSILVGALAVLAVVVVNKAEAGIKVKGDSFTQVTVDAKAQTVVTKASGIEQAESSKFKLKNWQEADAPADGSIVKTRSRCYSSYDLYSWTSYTWYYSYTSFYYSYSSYYYYPYVYYWRPTYYTYYWPTYVIIG